VDAPAASPFAYRVRIELQLWDSHALASTDRQGVTSPPVRSRTTDPLRSVATVKIPLLPGPADLVSAAEGLRDLVTESLALVPRVVTAVGQAELLLDRVSVLLARVEAVVDRAEDAVAGVAVVKDRADAAITGVEQTKHRADAAIAGVQTTKDAADAAIAGVQSTRHAADEAIAGVAGTRAAADAAIAGVDGTRAAADQLVGRASGLLDTATPLVAAYEPTLEKLAPLLARFADDLDPAEVEALVKLVDRLPTLVTHLDEDVLPVLATLDNVAPDVHALLDTVQDLRELAKGFPGSKLFRRRGAEEIAEEEAEERGRR
jgi:ABC-type transporter Mla subunit MlaD